MTGSTRGQSVIRVISGKMALNHRNPNWFWAPGGAAFSSPLHQWQVGPKGQSPNSAKAGLLAALLSLKHG